MRILILMMAILMVFALVVPARAAGVDLQLVDTTASRTVFRQQLPAGGRFTLVYRHSVEKSLVDEVYEVDAEGKIFLVETTVRASGYGLPECAPGQNCISHGAAVTFPGLHQRIADLIMRVSYLNDMWLLFEKASVNLPQVAPGGHRIRVQARPADRP
jgi:hypothetical protein